MLGIKGYKPNFSTNASEFIGKHKTDLRHLIGKQINCYYLQWETNENTWNEDGVIILEIDKVQYEFTAFKLDEFSLTISEINLSEKLDWYGAENEMPLIWKKNPIEEINVCLNKAIEEIYILEHSMTLGTEGDSEKKEFFKQLTKSEFFIIGVEFKLEGVENCLQLSNGLDCNVIKIETTKVDNKNRRIKIEKKRKR